MSKIKVMHVLNTGGYSGAENVAIELINMTRGNVDSVYVSPQGSIRGYLEENDIKFLPVKKTGLFEIRRAIGLLKPDIIHAHDFNASVVSAIAAPRSISVISHIHQSPPWMKKRNLRTVVYEMCSARYSKILAVSDSIIKDSVFGKKIAGKTVIIGNPINTEKIRCLAATEVAGRKADTEQKKETTEQKIVTAGQKKETPAQNKTDTTQGKSTYRYDIVFFGRLSAPKDPLEFVEIVRNLRDQYPHISAAMIGDGDLRPQVESRIEEYGLRNTITLTGFLKNPFPVLDRGKILCMPSLWEGYGLGAVEAMALGKPVVCSGAGGLINIVDESCGAICKGTEEYITAISELLQNSGIYTEKSRNAREKADILGDLKEYCTKINRIYGGVTG